MQIEVDLTPQARVFTSKSADAEGLLEYLNRSMGAGVVLRYHRPWKIRGQSKVGDDLVVDLEGSMQPWQMRSDGQSPQDSEVEEVAGNFRQDLDRLPLRGWRCDEVSLDVEAP